MIARESLHFTKCCQMAARICDTAIRECIPSQFSFELLDAQHKATPNTNSRRTNSFVLPSIQYTQASSRLGVGVYLSTLSMNTNQSTPPLWSEFDFVKRIVSPMYTRATPGMGSMAANIRQQQQKTHSHSMDEQTQINGICQRAKKRKNKIFEFE